MNIYRIVERTYYSKMSEYSNGREYDIMKDFKRYKDAKKEFEFKVEFIENDIVRILESEMIKLINNDDRKTYAFYNKNDKEMTIVDIFIIKIKL